MAHTSFRVPQCDCGNDARFPPAGPSAPPPRTTLLPTRNSPMASGYAAMRLRGGLRLRPRLQHAPHCGETRFWCTFSFWRQWRRSSPSPASTVHVLPKDRFWEFPVPRIHLPRGYLTVQPLWKSFTVSKTRKSLKIQSKNCDLALQRLGSNESYTGTVLIGTEDP